MANKTTNYGLTKPLPEEFYDVNVQNENMDIIDENLKKISEDAKKYTDEKLNDIPTPDVSGQISTHNTDGSAHADIRTALNGKAPSGYGLGGSIGSDGAEIPLNESGVRDFNKAINTGWYWIYPNYNYVNCPDVDHMGYTTMLVERYRHTVQTLYVNYQLSAPVVWRRMSHVDDTENWYPWECISHTYGTTDLTAGSSPLANGQLYFVYE